MPLADNLPIFESVAYYDAMPVSVPEKVLEHWSSQYLTYRYRSKSALWWPSRGEDIDVRWLPARPGKVVQVELKTTTIVGRKQWHDVIVDLGQLWDYHKRPHGRQPFYVFPYPDWPGTLESVAVINNRPISELAFARSGSGWWFANWMVALTTQDVVNILSAEVAAHASRRRGETARLVRFDPRSGRAQWGSGVSTPNLIKWRDLWQTLEWCGEPGWPQSLRVPAVDKLNDQTYLSREDIRRIFQLSDSVQLDGWHYGDLVSLESDENGGFHVRSELTPGVDAGGETHDGSAVVDDSRQAVFIDSRALKGIA